MGETVIDACGDGLTVIGLDEDADCPSESLTISVTTNDPGEVNVNVLSVEVVEPLVHPEDGKTNQEYVYGDVPPVVEFVNVTDCCSSSMEDEGIRSTERSGFTVKWTDDDALTPK